MAAVIISIAQKHTFRCKEQSIFTKRAAFANHLPRIGFINGNNYSIACMRGGGCVDTVEDEPIAHEVQLAKLRRLRQLRNILIWFFVHFARTD